MIDATDTMRVLVADDEPSIRFVLQEVLEGLGHSVTAVEDGDAAARELGGEHYDLAFLDIRMPGLTGIEVLQQHRAAGGDVAIVIITAQNLLENAVESMKAGALDYLVKPFALAEVKALSEKALSTRALKDEVRSLRRAVGRAVAPGGERLVGTSQCTARDLQDRGKGRAPQRTGPDHRARAGPARSWWPMRSTRQAPGPKSPFIAVNAAAIPRELLESELFGHERGAFTGAPSPARAGRFREASGGTLFLDEIGDMPTDLQAKLLRVLQSGEVMPVGGRDLEIVDVRIVAATHRDLDERVREGSFREDLLYRLRVVPMSIPPLRERVEDVRTLALYFTERYAPELAEGAVTLPEAAINRLERHDWPGNVRELENAIKRALVLSTNDVLGPEEFDFLTARVESTTARLSLEELVVREVEDLFDTGAELTNVYTRCRSASNVR